MTGSNSFSPIYGLVFCPRPLEVPRKLPFRGVLKESACACFSTEDVLFAWMFDIPTWKCMHQRARLPRKSVLHVSAPEVCCQQRSLTSLPGNAGVSGQACRGEACPGRYAAAELGSGGRPHSCGRRAVVPPALLPGCHPARSGPHHSSPFPPVLTRRT